MAARTPLNITNKQTKLGVYESGATLARARARGFRSASSVVASLHVGLGDVGAVDFDVDLGVFFPFLLLPLERPSVADEVEGQQEAQHAEREQSDVDLEWQHQDESVRRYGVVTLFTRKSVCFLPRTGLLPGVPSWPERGAAAAEQTRH